MRRSNVFRWLMAEIALAMPLAPLAAPTGTPVTLGVVTWIGYGSHLLCCGKRLLP